jgi:cation diffusion facilitator CzcD-associated flavoprotein CzcO
MGDRTRVVIVGAGPAGLAAAVVAQKRFAGRGDVVVLERAAVGQSWRDRYAELRLNTTRTTSGLPGLAIPRGAGRWVGRVDYLAYLDHVARRLATPVRTGVDVRRLTRDGGVWTVHTDGGDVETRNVVVATGHDAVAVEPNWPHRDRFAGVVVHSSQVRRLGDYAGRRVVIVGGGNTGVDMAGHLARLDADVTVCVRTAPTILPREVLRLPLQPLGIATRWLPCRIRDALTAATARATLGDTTALGLPRPPVGAYTRFATTGVTIAVDTGFLDALRRRRARVAPTAIGWHRDGVILTDQTVAAADVVILATGYRCDLASLVGHLDVLDARERPIHRAPDNTPGLFFAGYRPAVEGTLRRHAHDARLIAHRAI